MVVNIGGVIGFGNLVVGIIFEFEVLFVFDGCNVLGEVKLDVVWFFFVDFFVCDGFGIWIIDCK